VRQLSTGLSAICFFIWGRWVHAVKNKSRPHHREMGCRNCDQRGALCHVVGGRKNFRALKTTEHLVKLRPAVSECIFRWRIQHREKWENTPSTVKALSWLTSGSQESISEVGKPIRPMPVFDLKLDLELGHCVLVTLGPMLSALPLHE